jgi:ribosomal protein S18 acetylase RimI-like enzyme
MANQDFGLTGALKIRPAEEDDATHLHAFCFPEKTKTQVTKELQADLESDGQTHRLVAESSGYPIGQITVSKDSSDPEAAQVGNLAVSGPFRQLGVADHLIKAAEATAAEDGAKILEIELPSSETNVIQRYKDWGFIEKPLVTLQKALDAEEQEEEAEVEVEEPEDTGGDEDQAAEPGGEQQELLNA